MCWVALGQCCVCECRSVSGDNRITTGVRPGTVKCSMQDKQNVHFSCYFHSLSTKYCILCHCLILGCKTIYVCVYIYIPHIINKTINIKYFPKINQDMLCAGYLLGASFCRYLK